jgi:methylmalonyl-CoA mutase cobalamin-binding subunit
MTDEDVAEPPALGIAAVERASGLPKDTLRAWERRYGFPNPHRDRNDERTYPADQLAKLRLLRRLVDAGHRPGRIVGRPEAELAILLREAEGGVAPAPAYSPHGATVLTLLGAYDAPGLRNHINALLLRSGLGAFVTEVAPGMMNAVGAAWARGELEIHQEHLFTEQFTTVLRAAINTALASGEGLRRPTVLLTTVPLEPHSLGLLMAEAMFVLAGCPCISLGVQTPIPDIAAAARAHRADVLALSFSGVVPPAHAQAALADLRALAGPEVEIWAGGAGAARRPPAGVTPIPRRTAIAPAVTAWRERSGTGSGPTPG